MVAAVRRARVTPVLACLILLTTGCASIDAMAFREDRRLRFVTPGYREEVKLPAVVDWDVLAALADDLASRRVAGFAVLLDQSPQPPGESLRYFARDDDACVAANGCPDGSYLADRGIFTTRETRFVFEQLPPRPEVNVEDGDIDVHEVTVILVDEGGRRLGESAWTATFVSTGAG